MTNKLANVLLKAVDNKYASLATDGVNGDVKNFIDSGCYVLNAILSGDIYGGLPDNKIVCLQGEAGTGKSFFALSIAKNFQDVDKDSIVVLFETEGAVTSDILEGKGIDKKRLLSIPVTTVEEFRKAALDLAKSIKLEGGDTKVMFILDSLGNLSTSKEINDTAEGKETRDMTRSQVIKASFRVLSLELSKMGIPLIMTNHTYDVIGCLTKDHKVRLSNGSLINIDKVMVGDVVETLIGPKEVIDTYAYEDSEVYEIELESGEILKTSPEHKFLNQEMEWKCVKDLSVDDIIISLGRGVSEGHKMRPLKIKSIKKIEKQAVYDIAVKDAHHYILESGIVSHNSYVPTKIGSGGSGPKYMSSIILDLRKTKAKGQDTGGLSAEKDRIGSFINVKSAKSRFVPEDSTVKVLLRNKSGLDKYFGLFDLGKDAGIFEKDGQKWKNNITGESVKASKILAEETAPEFFTKEVLDAINAHVKSVMSWSSEESVDFTESEK